MNNFTVKFFEAKKGYSATKEYEHYNCECAQLVTEDDLAQVIFMTVRTAEGMDLDTQKILDGACALMYQSNGVLFSSVQYSKDTKNGQKNLKI